MKHGTQGSTMECCCCPLGCDKYGWFCRVIAGECDVFAALLPSCCSLWHCCSLVGVFTAFDLLMLLCKLVAAMNRVCVSDSDFTSEDLSKLLTPLPSLASSFTPINSQLASHYIWRKVDGRTALCLFWRKEGL